MFVNARVCNQYVTCTSRPFFHHFISDHIDDVQYEGGHYGMATAGVKQSIDSFFGGKGIDIQQRMSVWVGSPKSDGNHIGFHNKTKDSIAWQI